MKKTLHRDLVFTAKEVKEALIGLLREKDQPYPDDNASTLSFKLSEHGAELAWSESTEH